MDDEKLLATPVDTGFGEELLPCINEEERMRQIAKGIEKAPDKFESYCEAHVGTHRLIFPSIDRDQERFDIDGGGYFLFQARPEFRDIFEQIRNEMKSLVFVRGPSGWGKSHVLAVLAVFLWRNGCVVLYIPNAGTLSLCHLVNPISQALRTALYPKETKLDGITLVAKSDDDKWITLEAALAELKQHAAQSRSNRPVLIVDQLDNLKDSKRLENLFKLSSSLKVVYSASSNIQSHFVTLGTTIQCQPIKQASIHVLSPNLC